MLSQLNVTTGDEMLGLTGDPISTKVANIIRQVRQGHPIPFMVLHIIPAGEPKEALFFSSLIIDWESTVSLQASYPDFYNAICSGRFYQPPAVGRARSSTMLSRLEPQGASTKYFM